MISMGKTIDVLKDIYGKNHWCHIKIRYLCEKQVDVIEKYDIHGQNHWCLYRYLWQKPLMSYKNTISMGKTIDVI